jgi:hypothetical protein
MFELSLRILFHILSWMFVIGMIGYLDGCGIELFRQACRWDLESVVAKQKHAPYVTD